MTTSSWYSFFSWSDGAKAPELSSTQLGPPNDDDDDAPSDIPPVTVVDVDIMQTSAAVDDDDANDNHDDTPPAFPALSSAQRLLSSDPLPSSLQRRSLLDSSLMPPPSIIPNRLPTTTTSSPLVPRRPSSSSLVPPPSTTKPPRTTRRAKVALAPGHSPLDWANLKSLGQDLRGVTGLARIPPSELKKHNKPSDAWSAINGKVYNITPYLPFHPGGEKELMRVAGRDGTKLFATTHAWINVDFMLDACLVGFLVSEPS